MLLQFKYGYYGVTLILRLAVPFFFVVAGYFFAKNAKKNGLEETKNKYVKRLLIPYLFWGTATIIVECIARNYFLQAYISIFFRLLTTGDRIGIMWFSGALIWSIIIISKLKTKKQLKISIVISLILFIIGLLFNTYNFVLYFRFPELSNALANVFCNNRSFWFVGYLFTSIGYFMGSYGIKDYNRKTNYIVLFISIILLVLEVHYIHEKLNYTRGEYDFFLSHILLIPSLVSL